MRAPESDFGDSRFLGFLSVVAFEETIVGVRGEVVSDGGKVVNIALVLVGGSELAEDDDLSEILALLATADTLIGLVLV